MQQEPGCQVYQGGSGTAFRPQVRAEVVFLRCGWLAWGRRCWGPAGWPQQCHRKDTPPRHSLPRGTGGGNCGSWGLRIWGPGRMGRERSCGEDPCPPSAGAPSQCLPDTHTSIHLLPLPLHHRFLWPLGAEPRHRSPFPGGASCYSPPQIRAWTRGPPLWPWNKTAVVSVELGVSGSEETPPIFGALAPGRKAGRGTEGKREQQGRRRRSRET